MHRYLSPDEVGTTLVCLCEGRKLKFRGILLAISDSVRARPNSGSRVCLLGGECVLSLYSFELDSNCSGDLYASRGSELISGKGWAILRDRGEEEEEEV